MLPRIIYEPLPFALFAFSLCCFIFQLENFYFWSALLMLLSSWMLVKRSNYRRKDKQVNKSYKLPNGLYEFLPYAYIFIGCLVYISRIDALAFFGLFAIICGMGIFILREANRHAFLFNHY
ncbi:hypothetical protein DS2_13349 [Catenovulum agarivorans DS-2]|uniref:Uncharacterized protein n=1 Tax=Catenovulum agarivorans DS-2 TaxID=1328313 RepID=W7QB97_9ALTE|nr:hypothetical protein DS2_13349 [Catenovulum agarivorans DS-2]